VKVIVYLKERGSLKPIASVDVPDNAADPETTGWNTYTRSNQGLDAGTFEVHRQGKAFSRRRTTGIVSAASGLVDLP
jgi:hypothetical protein